MWRSRAAPRGGTRGIGAVQTAQVALRVPSFPNEAQVVLPEAKRTLRIKFEPLSLACKPTRPGTGPGLGLSSATRREGAKEPELERPGRKRDTLRVSSMESRFPWVEGDGSGVSPHQLEEPERLVSGRHLVASPGTAPPSAPWGLS